ncbi:hypothetical protein NFI96_008304 [Prochilodus magdalenae]|nr:hypothetical protein NFI96_008304 [Prochilodus magdalenae]
MGHMKGSIPFVKLLKFADDITLIGLIQDGDESAYWRRHPSTLIPLTTSNSPMSTVDTFKFLDTIISRELKWVTDIDSILEKAQQRMYFLQLLRKLGLPQEQLIQFYTAVKSVLCTSITVWFGAATVQEQTTKDQKDSCKNHWCSTAHPPGFKLTFSVKLALSRRKENQNKKGSCGSRMPLITINELTGVSPLE